MSPSIIFRCDATTTGGSGHVMRCLALAGAAVARGLQVRFVCQPQTLSVAPALARSGIPVSILSQDGAGNAAIVMAEITTKIDLVVVDSYELGLDFEALCRTFARDVLVIDDLADRPRACDWLLNAAPGFAPSTYVGRVPAAARLLLGTRYALVHPAFLAQRNAALARRTLTSPARRVLVALGGTDPVNGTCLALEALSLLPDLEIDVALGASAPHLDEVRRRVSHLGARLHIDTLDMPGLMRDADLAIGAGGTSTWERCALGLPSLIVTIAANQVSIVKAANEAGVAIDLGTHTDIDATELRAQAVALLSDSDRRSRMAMRAADLIDGLGGARVLDEVMGMSGNRGDQ